MGRSEEDLRVEAVRRRLAGESPERIVRSVGRSRRWVSKWVARHEPAKEEWAASRRPGRVVNRTDAALEAQVVAVRARLAEDPWAQVGSDAIAWELSKLDVDAPCTRTIERSLARAGLVHQRRRERPKSKGLPYPAPVADRVGDLHQADIVGPRHLDAERLSIATAARSSSSASTTPTHRYRATGKRTPDELTAGVERRRPTPLSQLPSGWPEQGRIEFIRFIRSDRKLRLLRRSIEMPESQVWSSGRVRFGTCLRNREL